MPNYKITFAKNSIASCHPTDQKLPADLKGNIYHHHDLATKQLIFAIVNAHSMDEAIQDTKAFIKQYSEKA